MPAQIRHQHPVALAEERRIPGELLARRRQPMAEHDHRRVLRPGIVIDQPYPIAAGKTPLGHCAISASSQSRNAVTFFGTRRSVLVMNQ